MMSNTLGASFGGTTRGVQAFDSEAFSSIAPPKFGGGGGSNGILGPRNHSSVTAGAGCLTH